MEITERRLNLYLDEKGFRHAVKGFGYLKTAIRMKIEDDTISTGRIYELTAELHGTLGRRVERCIRTAIGNSNCSGLTNGEFIAKAADDLMFDE